MTHGRFISFEGGEGAGKSTQIANLASRLRQNGCDVEATREPGGTPFAEAVRDFILKSNVPAHEPLSEALLFAAARADHITKRIEPALKRGTWVICDRFIDSTRAYQGAAGGVDAATIDALEQIATNQIRPDLTFVVDLDPVEGLKRVRARQATAGQTQPDDPYEQRDLAFHTRLRNAFLKIAQTNPDRCCLIDGSQPEQDVANSVWHEVSRRFLPEAN